MLDHEMKMWKEESGCLQPIMYRYSMSDKKVTICTSTPGYLIGRGGELYNKYTEIIKQRLRENVEIVFLETQYGVI